MALSSAATVRLHPRGRRRAALVAVMTAAITASGCAGQARRGSGVDQPPRAAQSERPPPAEVVVEHRRSGTFASSYGVRQPISVPPLVEAVLDRLRVAALKVGRMPPVVDQGTQCAALEICRGLPDRGPPAAAVVEFAMRSCGLVEPPPHMVIADLPRAGPGQVAAGIGERFEAVLRTAPYSRAGISACNPLQTPSRRRLVAALTESRVRLAPVPRRWRRGEQRELAVKVDQGYRNLQLVVADPGGQVRSRAMRRTRAGALASTLRCTERGVYRVGVTGEGRFGSEVLAIFPIYCGVAPPTTVRYRRQVGALAAAPVLARDIARRTSETRVAAGLPPLSWRDDVAEIARQHSEDMRAAGFVGHVSPSSGSAADRLQRAGIAYLVARENVARAYSVAEAMSELLNSPAHRKNILSPDVTEIGVGVAVDHSGETPVLLVTQNFVRPAMAYDPRTVGTEVLRIIRARRRAAGLSRLQVDPRLNRLAAEYVRAITREGRNQQQADHALSSDLRRLSGAFRRVDGVLLRLTAIEQVGRAEELVDRSWTHLGFAVIKHDAQLAVFVLLAAS